MTSTALEASPIHAGNGRTVVIIRPSSRARDPWYIRLRAQGFKLLLVHAVHDPTTRHLFDEWVVHPTSDIDGMVEVIQGTIAASNGALQPACAVISYDEYGVYPAAVISERLGLRPIPFESDLVRLTHNKYRFREWCKVHGVRGPRSICVSEPLVMEDVLREMSAAGVTFPVVIKPSVGAGSLQVSFAHDNTALASALRELFNTVGIHADSWHFNSVSDGFVTRALVEEYIGGGEVDVDCIVDKGAVVFAGIADNFSPPSRLAIEVGGLAPSALPEEAQAKLMGLLESYLKQVPHISGVLHFEAKYDFDRGEAFVIEVNCRPGSAETDVMVSNAWGVHLGDAVVYAAAGLSLGPYSDTSYLHAAQTGRIGARSFSNEYFASTNMYTTREGWIASVELPKADPNYVEGNVNPILPGIAKPPEQNGRMIAWMVARGSCPKSAVQNLRQLEAAVKVTFDDSKYPPAAVKV